MSAPTYGRRRDDVSQEHLAADLAAAEARVEGCARLETAWLGCLLICDSDGGRARAYQLLRRAVCDGEQARKRASWCRRAMRELEVSA